MKKSLIIFLSLVVVVLSAYGESERVFVIVDGFATVNYYMQLSENEKLKYVMGFLNGLTVAPFVVNEKGEYKLNIKKSLLKTDISNHQLEVVLSKYFREHPGVWHKPLNTESYFALQDAFFPIGIK